MTEQKDFRLDPELHTKMVVAATEAAQQAVSSEPFMAALAGQLLYRATLGPGDYMAVPLHLVDDSQVIARPINIQPAKDGPELLLVLTKFPVARPTCYTLLVLPAAVDTTRPLRVGESAPQGEPVLLVWRDYPCEAHRNQMVTLRDYEQRELIRQLAEAGIVGPLFLYVTQVEGRTNEQPEQHGH